jgi:ferredoxin
LCRAKGRVPFISSPQLCARCGRRWPELFVVPDRAWNYYTDPGLRDQIVCEECFRSIREAVDGHNARPFWLPSDAEIEEYIRAWRDQDRAKLMELEPGKFKQ